MNQMFIYDPDTYVYWAFDGERRLITAMVSVTQAEAPIAYLSTGHGENVNASAFNQLLVDSGYKVETIDLTKQDFHEDARLLVIMNPQFDFEGSKAAEEGRVSEIQKIADWLDDKGNLMVFRGGVEQSGTAATELPELDALLAEWGLKFETSRLIDSSNSIITGAGGISNILEGKYATDDSFGASMVSEIASLESAPKTVVPYARPIELVYDMKNNRETSAVLYSQSTALKTTGGDPVPAGEVPVIAASREYNMVNNVEQYNYVYAIGSLNFSGASYLNASYANSDILYRMMRQMGRAQVPIDLDFKVFETEALDINIDTATYITWGLVLALPAVVFTAGIIVHIRRKHA